MSTITRRYALTVGAAALVTGTAVNAVAETADPIFELIERHRTASVQEEETRLALDLFDDHCPRDLLRGPRVKIESRQRLSVSRLERDGGNNYAISVTKTGKTVNVYAQTVSDIKKLAPGKLSEAARERWIAQRVELLKADEARLARAQERRGRTKLANIAYEADDAEREARWNLATALPSTLAGLAALVSYGNECGGFSELMRNDEWLIVHDWRMACATCSLAGLPKPDMPAIVAELLDEPAQS
jgi:hypothetical protein